MRRDREHTCVTKEKPRLCKVGLFGDEFHANRAITFLTQRMLCSISFVSCHSIHFLSFFFLIFNIRWSLLNKKIRCANFKQLSRKNMCLLEF